MRYSTTIGSWLTLAGFVIAAAGCAGTQDRDSLLDYSKSAEQLFDTAMEDFDDEDCVDAEKVFQDVRRKFPYSRFAVLAELRIADCHFIQGNFAEATVSYQQFTKAHPTHEEAHYAAFKRGLAYYELIPGDWVITPPPHERDQAATRDARTSLSHFVRTYPSSELVERAEEIIDEVEDALVRHEIYVASFYLERDQKQAAAVRLEYIPQKFSGSSLVPDAMFLQGTTYLRMNRFDEARQVFGLIIERFPDHHQAKRAQDYLQHLEAKTVDADGGDDG